MFCQQLCERDGQEAKTENGNLALLPHPDNHGAQHSGVRYVIGTYTVSSRKLSCYDRAYLQPTSAPTSSFPRPSRHTCSVFESLLDSFRPDAKLSE